MQLKEIVGLVAIVVCLYFATIKYSHSLTYSATNQGSYGVANSSKSLLNLDRPSNVTIVLKNDTSKPADMTNSINSVIAAVGAVGGASVGSYFTYRYGNRIEREKANREKKKELEFSRNIREMVRYEMKTYYDFILNLSKNADVVTGFVSLNSLPDVLLKLKTFPRQYLELSVERKANVFKGETLTKVEAAYHSFDRFIQELETLYENKNLVKSLHQTRFKTVLDVTHIAMEAIDKHRNDEMLS